MNFEYKFDGSQTPYDGTAELDAGRVTGLGYFGSTMIASPQFICHPLNILNAFTNNFPNWLSTVNGQIDLRAFYVTCKYNSTSQQYYYDRIIPDQPQVLDTISSYTGSPVAYTTEALYYAQSGYFVTVVMVQWANLFACKTRKVFIICIIYSIRLFTPVSTNIWFGQSSVRPSLSLYYSTFQLSTEFLVEGPCNSSFWEFQDFSFLCFCYVCNKPGKCSLIIKLLTVRPTGGKETSFGDFLNFK